MPCLARSPLQQVAHVRCRFKVAVARPVLALSRSTTAPKTHTAIRLEQPQLRLLLGYGTRIGKGLCRCSRSTERPRAARRVSTWCAAGLRRPLGRLALVRLIVISRR